MTKEELAKKKGIKLPEKKETPAEALINNTSSEKANVKAEEKSATSKSRIKNTSTAATKKPAKSKNATEAKAVKPEAPTQKKKTSDKTPNKDPHVKAEATDLIPESPISDKPSSPDNTKRGVGKPKKRKPGDKKLSLWIDENLVDRMYNNRSYGDSAGELLNKALLEYLDNHNLH